MKRFYLILSLSLSTFIQTSGQDLLFAQRAGSDSDGSLAEEGQSVTTDNEGNIYVTGRVDKGSSGAIFGEGQPNETTLPLGGAFVAKYDPEGILAWVEYIGTFSNGNVTGRAIAVDKDGNIYIAGHYYQLTVFDEGEPSEVTLQGEKGEIFVVKYDNNGVLQWAKGAGGLNDDGGGRGIVLDSNSDVYVTGSFWDTATFGSGDPNQTELKGQDTDIFIAKYNTDGVFQWVQSAGGANFDGGKNIDLDQSGNIYITGNYFDAATFGAGLENETILDDSNESAFIAKYNNDGLFLWAIKPFISETADISGDIKATSDGGAVFTGAFSGEITVGAGSDLESTLTGNGNDDVFLAKYSSEGNLVWATSAGSTEGDRGVGVDQDEIGNIFVTGYFGGEITFGKDERNETTIINVGSSDIYVSKFSPAGEFIWVTSAGSTDWEQGSDISVDASSNPVVSGFYQGNTTFGKDETNETTLSVSGFSDLYISKFESSFNSKPEFELVGDLTYEEDFEGAKTIAASQINTPTDETNQIVTYTIEPESSEVVGFSFDGTSGTLTLESFDNTFGEQSFKITADDGAPENYSFEKEFVIVIEPVNDAPVIVEQKTEFMISQGTSVLVSLEDLEVEDVDNTYPDDFTLSVFEGDDYTFSGNEITPNEDFFGTLQVPVKVNDGTTDSEAFNIDIEVQQVVGLDNEFIENSFTIYPIPADDVLYVTQQGKEESFQIRIFDQTGTMIHYQKSNETQTGNILDLTSLAKGIYFLHLKSASQTGVKKILKN